MIVVDLLAFVVLLIAGMLLGYFLRGKKSFDLGKVTFGVIMVLIFSLGFSIGSNNELLSSLPRVGLSALVISLLAILFSVVLVKTFAKLVRLK